MTDAAVQRAIDHADLARDAADDAKEIAVRAEAKIDSHDRVCSERYSRILQNQETADAARAGDRQPWQPGGPRRAVPARRAAARDPVLRAWGWSMTDQPRRAADDYDRIAARLAEIRREREKARAEAEALRAPETQPVYAGHWGI